MTSSLSKVSGGALGSASTSTSTAAAGLRADSYEEQLQKQEQHLTSRHCYQVQINVLGARNIPPISRGKRFYVTLEGMTKCGGFKLETPAVEKVENLRWPGDYRMLHFEASTTGLSLELTCTRNMGRDQSLGRVAIPFEYLLQQPERSVEAWFRLQLGPQKKNSNSQTPELRVKACIQAAIPSPFLLRAVQGDFQKDNLQTIKPKKGQTLDSKLAIACIFAVVGVPPFLFEDENQETIAPEGRWSTRVMVDHNAEEKYLVRVRRAKPKKKYQKAWNAPVEEWEKEVCIFQQRVLFDPFNRKKLSVEADSVSGWAQHQIGTNWFKKNNHVERQWSLFATEDIVFKVRRDDNNDQWMENLDFELSGQDFGYPVELRTGRHLQYEVPLGKHDQQYESGYVTVIRKTPADSPIEKATALFNWKAVAVEVSPEENVTMVMLMAVVTALVVQGWYEEETIHPKAREAKKTKAQNSRANKHGIWGAVSMDSNNSMALSALLWKFKEYSYLNIDVKIYRDQLNTIPQPEWSLEMFELFYDIFGGGGKIDDIAGYEGGYIGLNKGRLGFLKDNGGGDGGGGECDGGGNGGGCGGIWIEVTSSVVGTAVQELLGS